MCRPAIRWIRFISAVLITPYGGGAQNDREPYDVRGQTPTAKICRPPMGALSNQPKQFPQRQKEAAIAASYRYFQSPRIREGYFSNLRLSTSSRTLICLMAIWFRRFRRSRWGMPSPMNTALRFSRLERQISWLMVA